MRQSTFVTKPPNRRPLKIFAFDPMLGRTAENRITIEVLNEPLMPGPQGNRIAVIDYDATNDCYYDSVNLSEENILIQGGLDPNESDPRFHQQMVYAVAMKVLENFDIALGRRIRFRKGRRLRIFPHAIQEANAFYDPKLLALVFGYFRADEKNPGPNIPGQTVFSCLSHDIIAHEMTHALTDRLRRYFIEPTNEDVGAFHEGFSDIIAIFQHFSFPGILRERIQEQRGNLRSPNNLIELAQQFGYATGKGQALRSALETPDNVQTKPDPTLYSTVFESHERGTILVAAVFDAFFTTYQRRIRDLLRIATGGTGRLPEGEMHPDLVNRISNEASRTAQSILTMCIRAFEYLPPVDIRFGDYLRALVTADFELNPRDEFGQRSAMIEAFRARGIYADNVVSLAEESLILESPKSTNLNNFPVEKLGHLIIKAAYEFSQNANELPPSEDTEERVKDVASMVQYSSFEAEGPDSTEMEQAVHDDLRNYANGHRDELNLDPKLDIQVLGFHPVFRVAPQGALLVELVAQFAQRDRKREKEEDYAGVPIRGGTTVIAAADGTVRYVISKPLPYKSTARPENEDRGHARLKRHREFVHFCDRDDSFLPWADDSYIAHRIMDRMNFAAAHRGIIG